MSTPTRRPLLLWATPPIVAALAASWSIDHHRPALSVHDGGPRGEHLPRGTASISGRLVGPDGESSASGVEVDLVREATLARLSPAAWRCCRSCGFALFDEYCDLSASVVAKLDQRKALEVAPARIAMTSHGGFTFSSLPPGRYVVYAAAPKGALAVAGVEVAAQEDRAVVLESPFRATLAGSVLDTAGQPIARAKVIALDPRVGRASSALTDEHGRFAVLGLDPDVEYDVVAAHPGYAPTARAGLVAGEELALELPRGEVMSGVVTSSGTPVKGAIVDLDESVDGAVTDAEGRFRFDQLTMGPHLVRVATRGPAPRGRWLEVSVSGSEEQPVEVALSDVRPLAIRVSDAAGAPVAGAEVLLSADDAADHRSELTDASGVAIFDLVPLGAWSVTARRGDDRSPASAVELTAGAEPLTLGLKLEGTAGVSGRVFDERGRAVDGAEIVLEHLVASSNSDDDVPRLGRTDASGRFVVPSLAIGQWEITARKAGYVERTSTFDIEDEKTSASVDLTLSEGGRIRGVLLDPDDRPVAGWAIAIAPHGQERGASLPEGISTGPDGAFALAGLESGEYVLLARPPHTPGNFAPDTDVLDTAPVVAKTGEGQVVLRTRGAGSLEGSLVFLGREVPEAVRVSVPGLRVRSFAGASGGFWLDGAPAGTYVVSLRAAGFASVAHEVTVKKGELTRFGCVLRASAELRGRVVDADTGGAVARATVVAVPEDDEDGPRARATTRLDGTFELGGLAAGEVHLAIDAPGYETEELGPFVAPPSGRGPSIRLDLGLRPHREVGRRATPSDDAPTAPEE